MESDWSHRLSGIQRSGVTLLSTQHELFKGTQGRETPHRKKLCFRQGPKPAHPTPRFPGVHEQTPSNLPLQFLTTAIANPPLRDTREDRSGLAVLATLRLLLRGIRTLIGIHQFENVLMSFHLGVLDRSRDLQLFLRVCVTPQSRVRQAQVVVSLARRGINRD